MNRVPFLVRLYLRRNRRASMRRSGSSVFLKTLRLVVRVLYKNSPVISDTVSYPYTMHNRYYLDDYQSLL